jgi:ABC-2 type transport system ATP-binding protein
MTYTVETKAITKSFGDHRALDGVDLQIEGGTIFALLGPNGAGKTTMVRVLATLTRPDSGSATVCGHDLIADPLGVKREISLTGQFAAVDDVLTGRENLDLMARLRRLPGRAARARTAELLEAFHLTNAADRRAGTYSGGMKRRLDLAMGMIERPQLLFLDEPTTGLDPRSREQLWDTTARLVEEGVTILLTTQYLEEADRLADTIAVLDRGRIVARGTAAELKARVGGATMRLRLADGSRMEVPTDGSSADIRDTLARLEAEGIDSPEVSIQRPTLDDVFLHLTDGARRPELPHDDQIDQKEVA